MTDTPDVDETGAGGNQPPVSPSAIAGQALDPQELLKLRDDLELTRRELRGLQSGQDKTQNELQRFMGEIKAKVANGMTLEDAEKSVTAERQAVEDKDLLRRIAAKVGIDQPSTQAAGNGVSATDEVAKAIEFLQLDENDPAVVQARRNGATVLQMVEIAAQKAKQPTPSPSDAPALQGGVSVPKNEAAMIAELQEWQKEPSKHKEQIAARIKELKW